MKFTKSLTLYIGLVLFTAAPLKAQMETIYNNPDYGPDSASRIACANNLSTMSEYMKIDLPTYAYQSWKQVFDNCPKASKNIYLHGAKIIKHYLENAENDTRKQELLDTLMLIYDRRIEHFDQEGYVLGRKAIDLLRYDRTQIDKAYEIFERSIESEQEESEEAVLVTFMQTSVTLFRLNKSEASTVVDDYIAVSNILNAKAESGRLDSRLERAISSVEGLFSDSGAANCEDLIGIFEPQLEANKDDAEWLKKATGLLRKTGCEESPLFANASEALYKLEPSAFAAYNNAQIFMKKGDYEKAAGYLKEAVELEEDPGKKANYYYRLGLISNAHFGQPVQARDYAREAIALDEDFGDPYILIGQAYIAGRERCGENEFERAAVFWAAVDQFYKAKSVDPEVEEEANELIERFSQYFPNKEDAFFYGFSDGDSYTVGCWINETTRVRTIQ